MSAVASSPAAGRRPAPRNRVQRFLTSSIGLKLIMAFSGVFLSFFVLGHMLGNLQAYQGQQALDDYGKLLRKEPALLWTARVGLLTLVALHIYAFLALTRRNTSARPVGYRQRKWRESSYASRSMSLTGPLLLAFIIYHILHLTTGTVHPQYREGEVYHNLVTGLGGVNGVIYILAMAMLAFHLWHGVWSMLLTLGLPEGRYRSLGRRGATLFTALVVIGFATLPLAVLTGILK
ncbi:succinate dehydrogenase cytochrome b subunit [Paludisphaera mucosa]|uniref:Succinate dehydrogenase cytochrome b subunit n=1 Tax=Paludisphaera mucosa TaxID=3030827 RepID=A0ABT6F7H8_9BACT|nr:succinate dehydrogenase cytochrome b subunit [Paludisphaera mucosa]MDG3003546.1 succinate dehydrogenase cytochrome b subunit [Paludisphaera mucosa]